MLNFNCLEELENYIKSGQLEDEFLYSENERRGHILEFLEKIMDISDEAETLANKLIFQGSLVSLLGINNTKTQE